MLVRQLRTGTSVFATGATPSASSSNVTAPSKAGEEARTVFSDHYGLLIDDPEHSGEWDRFLLLGLSASLRTLVVAHCYRKADDVIRIISPRKATRRERDIYNRRWGR